MAVVNIRAGAGRSVADTLASRLGALCAAARLSRKTAHDANRVFRELIVPFSRIERFADGDGHEWVSEVSDDNTPLEFHPAGDEYQQLVNANCLEDQGHWQWYLSDLAQLGRNQALPYTDALRLIWGDATTRTRRLSYHLAHLGLASDSLGRLVLIHGIEGAFETTVGDLEPVAQELSAETGKSMLYLGNRHAADEASHTLARAEVRRLVEGIELATDEAARFTRMVDDLFVLFRAFADEMRDLARG